MKADCLGARSHLCKKSFISFPAAAPSMFCRCPPCRGFTPQLASVYSALKARGVDVELVFVSHDRDEDQFQNYFKHMAELGGTWLAVPLSECQAEREMLASRCSVMGIPTLTVVGPDGSIIAPNARSAVSSDLNGDNFPWEGASGVGVGSPLVIIVFMVLVFFFLPKLIGFLFR